MRIACPQCGKVLEAPDPPPASAQCPFCMHVFAPGALAEPLAVYPITGSPGTMTAPPAADTGRVTLPAGLLIATGVCWVIFGVLATLVWVMQPKQQLPPRAQNDPAFGAGYEFGQTAAYLGMGPLSILLGSLVTLGAVQMLRLRSRGLALTASVAAMIPCLPCCLAGFPLGIWCLIVLNKPEVRSMFS